MRSPTGTHVVVIGASIAGLLTARVLSEFFERVTVIERDTLADTPDPRKGVPQGRHVHGLLNRGNKIMEELFPDLFPALVAGGAWHIDLSKDLSWHHCGLWKRNIDSGVKMYTMSRPYLEWHIRTRVARIPNVQFIDRHHVTGLVSDANRARIVGVSYRPREATEGSAQLAADLVVDASGRGSQTPVRLAELGYPKPAETTIKINVGYATRIFRRPENFPAAWKALMLYPTPPHGTRMGILFPIEGNRWLATAIGWVGDYPPDDAQGWLEFCRGMEAPDFYNAVRNAEALTPVTPYRFPSNLRRRYERLSRFPGGLIVLGDALCSFNPSYGQGMTTSSLAVTTLVDCLKEQQQRGRDIDWMARRFRMKVAKVLNAPWMIAAGEDLSWPQAEGDRSPMIAFTNWYLRRVHLLTAHDAVAVKRFLEVMNMLKPPSSIFRPQMLRRVLMSGFSAPRDQQLAPLNEQP